MKLFISYRRDDSKHQADRLHLALQRVIPKKNIFIDIDGIPAGVDFVKYINDQVAQCDVLLALIGTGWLHAKNTEGGRRLDDPEDFVRVEIATALNRGITVVPVLLDDARIPQPDELPPNMVELSRRNAIEVRRASFDVDAQRLIRKLRLGEHAGSALKRRMVVGSTAILIGALVFWATQIGVRNDPNQNPTTLSTAVKSGRCDNCPATTLRSVPGGKTLETSDPIAFQEWQNYCAEANCKYETERSGTRATLISWSMANQYLIWLSEKTNRKYRLPSVQEIEALQAGLVPEIGRAFSEWTMTCQDASEAAACSYYQVIGWDKQGKRLRDWHTPDSRGKSIGFRVVVDQ